MSNIIPDVQDVRGKVVILEDFSPRTILGIPWANLNSDESPQVLTLLPTSINSKWKRVKKRMDEARKDPTQIFVTFTSGGSSGAHPVDVADRINRRVLEYVQSCPTRKRLGIVVMDFPGIELIRSVIATNVRVKESDSDDDDDDDDDEDDDDGIVTESCEEYPVDDDVGQWNDDF